MLLKMFDGAADDTAAIESRIDARRMAEGLLS